MKMKPPSKTNLVVKGTGLIQPRGAPRSRPATTTMRRSESIGAIPRATVQAQPKKFSQPGPNYCVPPVQPSKTVDEQYARSLEQQVQLLELENRFLSQGKSADPAGSRPTSYSHILHRGNEVSLNGRDWCQLPSFHPPIEKVLADRMSRTTNQPLEEQRIEKEYSFDNLPSVPPTRDIGRRQSGFERGLQSPADSRFSTSQLKPHSPDAALLQELEEKNIEVEELRRRLIDETKVSKKAEDRLNQLTVRLREAESDLSSRSEADTRDKRALMEETLELQRRLDDLTPVLAEKEARIARVEDERDALVSKLRSANTELSNLKLKVSESSREEELVLERESMAKRENARLREQVEECQREMENKQRKEESLLDEISEFRRRVKEVELRHNNDRILVEQLNSENNKLIGENSRLTTEIAKLEYSMEKSREESSRSSRRKFSEEEVAELRLKVKSLETQITISEDRLTAANARCDTLEKEIEDRSDANSESRNERLRMQKELEALQALSRSLSTENKSLREEKMSLLEKMEVLKSKVAAREIEIKNLEDEKIALETKHSEDLRKSEQETQSNSQRALELEELSRRLRQLSDSIPSDRASTATRNSEVAPTRGASQAARRVSAPVPRSPILEESEYVCGTSSTQRVVRLTSSKSEVRT